MSRESRFDKLESDIVDALRRAPGVEPSSDLDARILARAHAAVAKPARRPQPIWFSMAAGLVVLVGSGLALRIWQQVEHAPTALDAPPAVSAPTQHPEGASAVPTVAPDAAAGAASEHSVTGRIQARPDAAAGRAVATASQADSELRRESSAETSTLDALDLSAGPASADAVMPSVVPMPKPFPAAPEAPEAMAEPADQPSMAPSAEVMRAPPISDAPAAQAPAQPPASAALQAPAPAKPAAPAEPGAMQTGLAAKSESAKTRAAEDAIAPGRDAGPVSQPELDDNSERKRAEPFDDQRIDTYAVALARVRQAIDAGDLELARRLTVELRREHPDRELPEDLRRLVDRPQ